MAPAAKLVVRPSSRCDLTSAMTALSTNHLHAVSASYLYMYEGGTDPKTNIFACNAGRVSSFQGFRGVQLTVLCRLQARGVAAMCPGIATFKQAGLFAL